MTEFVVADVGNTLVKWGRCSSVRVEEVGRLDPDDASAWSAQFDEWQLRADTFWLVTGVHPTHQARLGEWLRERFQRVELLDDPAVLPLQVRLEHPERVGIDRLFDAVAANTRREPGRAAIVVDVGSATTVDLLDKDGAFLGGAIAPGMRLMASALHGYTALLPLVSPRESAPSVPGTDTPEAMELGIFWSVVGGIRSLIEAGVTHLGGTPQVFLTGGDSQRIVEQLGDVDHWPNMTLEGIRSTAEAML